MIMLNDLCTILDCPVEGILVYIKEEPDAYASGFAYSAVGRGLAPAEHGDIVSLNRLFATAGANSRPTTDYCNSYKKSPLKITSSALSDSGSSPRRRWL